MAVLSKAVVWLQGAPVIKNTCHETFHTWHENCTMAWATTVPNGFKFSLKTYGTFYLASLILSNKGDIRKIDWKKYVQNVLRSTVFLTMNLVLYFFFACKFRQLLGFYSIPNIGYLNGITASFLAILIEKKSRRGSLALYLTNLASETVYRQLVNHGYLKFIPGGTFIPFSIGLALFKYLASRNSLGKGLRGIVSSTLQDHPKAANPSVMAMGKAVKRTLPSPSLAMIEKLKVEYSRGVRCDHNNSCVYNATKTFAHHAIIGLCLKSILTIVSNIKRPTKIVDALLSRNNLQLPLFFGLMPLIYNSTRCAMNRMPVSDTARDVVSAFAAGSAMTVYPTISISMFTLWKAIEALYTDLVDRGYLKWFKYGDILLYSISTGYVLGCVSFEPHAVRKGYMHFLEGLSGNRLKLFNRHHFDCYGAESSKLYGIPDEDFYPGHEMMKICL